MTDNIPTSPRDRARAVVALIDAAGLAEDADAWRQNIAAEIARAVQEETEACARLVEHDALTNYDPDGRYEALLRAAVAIRARGEADD